jgi:hypothetical protein
MTIFFFKNAAAVRQLLESDKCTKWVKEMNKVV